MCDDRGEKVIKKTTAQNKFSEGAREQIKRLRAHEISRNWAQARNIIFAEFLSCRGPKLFLGIPCLFCNTLHSSARNETEEISADSS